MWSLEKFLEKKGYDLEKYREALKIIYNLPEELNLKLKQASYGMECFWGHVHPEDAAIFHLVCQRLGLELGKDYSFYYVHPEDHHMDLCLRPRLEYVREVFDDLMSEISKHQAAMFYLQMFDIVEPTKKQLETAYKIHEFELKPCEKCREKFGKKVRNVFDALISAIAVMPSTISYETLEKYKIKVKVKYGCGHVKEKIFDLSP